MSDADWTVLEVEGVLDVIDQATRRVHSKYRKAMWLEDLKQEAMIFVVTHETLRSCIVTEEPELGLLQYRLERDLIDLVRPLVEREQKHISYDALTESAKDGDMRLAYVVIDPIANDYTRESVESLLPAVWDESFCYGLPVKETVPDPDMPRGSSNKATSNNLAAYIADIKVGWARSGLTRKERRALLLAYGLGWTQAEIGAHEGCTQQTIQERLYSGIGKVVARLNGGLWHELEGAA